MSSTENNDGRTRTDLQSKSKKTHHQIQSALEEKLQAGNRTTHQLQVPVRPCCLPLDRSVGVATKFRIRFKFKFSQKTDSDNVLQSAAMGKGKRKKVATRSATPAGRRTGERAPSTTEEGGPGKSDVS